MAVITIKTTQLPLRHVQASSFEFSQQIEKVGMIHISLRKTSRHRCYTNALCGVGKETMLRLNPFPFLQSFCLIYCAFWATVVVTQTQGRGLCALSRDLRAEEDNRRFRGGEAALVTTSVLRTQDRKEGKHTQEKLPQHPSSAFFLSAPASKNALVYFPFSLSSLKINVSNIL